MTYYPVGFRQLVDDVYGVRFVSDLLEDHKAGPLLRLDTKPNTLVVMCLRVLADTFCKSKELAPAILRALPHFNRDLFLHILPTSAPLDIVFPTLDSEVYWQRRCRKQWPKEVYKLKEQNYKQLFAETYLSGFLEKIEPGYEDYDEIKELCILLHKYVYKLGISSLRAAGKKGAQPDCEDVTPTAKRLDLRRVTAFLPKLTELHLCFGMDLPIRVSAIRRAVLLEDEIESLGEAIILSKTMTVLRIHTSCFKANDLGILYHYLVVSGVMVLQVDNCFLGNSGAQIAALLIKNHSCLLKLSLTDNDIGPEGGYALAYALTHRPASELKCLNIALNPIGDEAGSCIAAACVSHRTLREINMSGTRLGERSGKLFAEAVAMNDRIRNLDLSCNSFSRDNAVAFLEALEVNNLIEYLDLRSTGLEHETLQDIKDMLFENREAKREKVVSKSPKRIDRIRHVGDYLETLAEKNKTEPIIFDPVPLFGSHETSSLTLSDHGQLTLSTVDSTSSESTATEDDLCADADITLSEIKVQNKSIIT